MQIFSLFDDAGRQYIAAAASAKVYMYSVTMSSKSTNDKNVKRCPYFDVLGKKKQSIL